MNQLEQLKNSLPKNVQTHFEKSINQNGASWLDIFFPENQRLTIEWKPSFGFGLYINPENSFGSGPNEIYRKLEVLARRVKMIIDSKRKELSIKDLRKLSGKTQGFVSKVTGKGQSSISKLENQRDFQLSTLEEYVSALGGKINIRVHFDDFDIPIDLFDPSEPHNVESRKKEV